MSKPQFKVGDLVTVSEGKLETYLGIVRTINSPQKLAYVQWLPFFAPTSRSYVCVGNWASFSQIAVVVKRDEMLVSC